MKIGVLKEKDPEKKGCFTARVNKNSGKLKNRSGC
jgi:hypothetical protein